MAVAKKKTRERDVLESALSLARKRGGECRRLADKLDGAVVHRSTDECPDIVLSHRSSKGQDYIVGVEHFRVDQLTELKERTGMRMSTTSRARSRLNRLQEDFKKSGALEPDDGHVERLAEVIEELWLAQGMISLDGFVQGLSQVFSSHLSKVGRYRDNLVNITEAGENARLAFLVETHVDFSRLFLWRGYRRVALPNGSLPLFKELEGVLATAAGMVDYIILAMCPQTEDEVVDALILNCDSLSCSLSRQQIANVEYVGYSRSTSDLIAGDGTLAASHIEILKEEDAVRFLPVLDEGERLGGPRMFVLDLKEFGHAIGLRKAGKPFLATFGVEMLLELFGDCADVDWKRGVAFGLADLHRWIDQIGIEEARRRMSLFELNHDIRLDEVWDE